MGDSQKRKATLLKEGEAKVSKVKCDKGSVRGKNTKLEQVKAKKEECDLKLE